MEKNSETVLRNCKKKKKSETELTASFLKKDPKHTID